MRGVRIQLPNRLVGGQRSRRPAVPFIPQLYLSHSDYHIYSMASSTASSLAFSCASLSDPAQTDQEDEALNRWKASLGLGSGTAIADPNDPRKCVIKSLALVWLPFHRSSS